MNKTFRRLLSIVCLILVTVSLMAAPALADPTDTPTTPPVSNVIVVGPVVTATPAPTTPVPPPGQ